MCKANPFWQILVLKHSQIADEHQQCCCSPLFPKMPVKYDWHSHQWFTEPLALDVFLSKLPKISFQSSHPVKCTVCEQNNDSHKMARRYGLCSSAKCNTTTDICPFKVKVEQCSAAVRNGGCTYLALNNHAKADEEEDDEDTIPETPYGITDYHKGK